MDAAPTNTEAWRIDMTGLMCSSAFRVDAALTVNQEQYLSFDQFISSLGEAAFTVTGSFVIPATFTPQLASVVSHPH